MCRYIINDTMELDRKELEDFLIAYFTENGIPQCAECYFFHHDIIRTAVHASAFRIMRAMVDADYFTSITCYDESHTTDYRK